MIEIAQTPFFVGLACSAIGAPFILKVLVRARSRQTISEYVPEHASKQGTPTMGGLIVLLGLVAGALLSGSGGLVAPLLLVLGFAAIGFVDDYVVPRTMAGKRGLGWIPKLATQVVAALAALLLGGWNDPVVLGVAVFLVLFACNAYNFADGMDGLAGGLAVLLAAGLAQVLVMNGLQHGASTCLAALAGAMIPFLFLNAPPAKVFMGDVGALPIGALLGYAFAVAVWPAGSRAVGHVGEAHLLLALSLATMGFVLIAELVPVPLQILSVKLRKGKRLFRRTPIHHAFQHAGWPETRVVAMFLLAQFVLVVAALAIFPFYLLDDVA